MVEEEVQPIDPSVLRLSVIVLAVGTLLLAAFFGTLGVVLVYLGAQGTTHISFFHTSFETTDVGIGALCVGAAIVIAMLVRVSSLLKRSGGSRNRKIIIHGSRKRNDFNKMQ